MINNEDFYMLVKKLQEESYSTLISKNEKYATSFDPLHNFRIGGDILGGTPADACWGYLTKHLVALRDKVERQDFSDKADLLEKCKDAINYIYFLWCIGNEEHDNQIREKENFK